MGGGGLAPTAEEDGILTGKILPNPSLLAPHLKEGFAGEMSMLGEENHCLPREINGTDRKS